MIRATLVTFKKDGTGEDRQIGDVILPHAPRPGEWIWLPWMPTAAARAKRRLDTYLRESL